MNEVIRTVPLPVRASVVLQVVEFIASAPNVLPYLADSRLTQFGVVLFLIIAGLTAVLAHRTYRGRNWARIVLTVWTILGILSLVVDLVTGGGLYTVLDYLATAMSVAAVILLWTPSARRYFADISAARLSARTEPNPPVSRE
jgi:hypothetical protein